MSIVFERNMKLLEKHQPFVFNKINAYLNGHYKPLNSKIERILLANHGDIIINMLVISDGNEYLICDHNDPINQAYSWIDKYIDPSNKADIVFGLGFGYHIEVLLASFKNRKVILVEPNIELFCQIIKVRNMESIIEKTEIYVDDSMDTILQRLNVMFWDTEKGGIQCQPLEVYGDIFWQQWDELRSRFVKQVENFNVDIATKRFYGGLWVHNNIKNLKKIYGAANAAELIGKFTGVPGILVSAGPSLEKNIHLLKDLRDKCVIMAAGTSVNILENKGIVPHFMVGIDATESEAEIHRQVKSKEICFIYSNQIAEGSLDSYAGPKLLMNYSADIYTDNFLKITGVKANMFISGPSVSNTCFDLLYKMGCNPIILVGQDLAFTNEKLYAGDEADPVLKNKEELMKQGYSTSKDIYGKEILTRSDFVTMKNWFEGYFEKVKEKVEIINATEGGLNIEHARNDELSKVICGYSFREQPVLENIKTQFSDSRFDSSLLEKLKEYEKTVCLEIERLEAYTKDQARITDLIKREIYHPAKDKKAFDRAVAQLNKLMELVMGSPIYNSLLKNLIEIDFYLIKAEVDRSTKECSSYGEAKPLYVNAMEQQNKILKKNLQKLREYYNN
ncbi:MAG: DUF115 domain-containing protein [Clostridia bacterium]|nr:DUF115 domain-containing protein [Clostridia bacterium]